MMEYVNSSVELDLGPVRTGGPATTRSGADTFQLIL
jgi:hypothetical protein